MIDVGANLIAAQKLLQVRPVIGCTVKEQRTTAAIPDWSVVATLADTQQFMDGCVAGNGVLMRVRLSGGYVQIHRVVTPTSAASWAAASWVNVYATAAATPPAIFCDPQSGGTDVYIVFVTGATSRVLQIIKSTDYGVSFGAATAIYTHGSGAIEHVSGSMRTSGTREVVVFWYFAGATRVIYMSWYPAGGGSWSAPYGWPFGNLGACYGFDAEWRGGDWLLLLAGLDDPGGTACLWWVVYGDGGLRAVGEWAWGVIETSGVVGFSFWAPRLTQADVLRGSYLEVWTGTGAYRRQVLQRPILSVEWDQGYFLDPEPFEYEPSSFFSAVLCGFPASNRLYLVGHNKVWTAAPSLASTDLSAFMAGYDYQEDHDDCRLTVVLDNHTNALDAAGADGDAYRAVRVGAQVTVSRGLRVGATDYTQVLANFHIEALEHTSDNAGRKYLVLHCIGWWGMLAAWRAGRLFQWTGATTLASIGSLLAARVGYYFVNQSSEGSAFMATFSPTFSVAPGIDGRTALRQVAGKGADALRFDGSQSILYKELVRSEASDYAMGGAGEHPVLLGSFVEGAMPANVFEVYGSADALGAALDFQGLALVGTRRRKVGDGLYTTGAAAATRAGGEEERAHSAGSRGWVECFPVHGVEMWDVLGVTSGRHGFTGRRYRVVAIRERWEWTRGMYKQRLGLVALE
jgi:hypothetical protein